MSFFYKQNDRLEKLIGDYFKKIEQYCDKNYGGNISVILLGSLSRGEATWIETQNGPVMVSDIEYFTVYPEGFTDFDGFDKMTKLVANEVFGTDNSSLFHIDNSFVCISALQNMERKLLTYDAKCMGKCVVGKDCIQFLPQINLQNINLFDIRDILTHRVFSVLYYGLPLKQQGNLTEYTYNLAKNSLDLMTVMLVNHKRLESGFINRFEVIKTLPIDQKIKNYFEYCLSIKLSTTCAHSFTTDEMEQMFIMLVKNLKKDFSIPLSNVFANAKSVARRGMGILKRAVICKTLPYARHLESLTASLENGRPLSCKQTKNNLIINGYPTTKEN